MERKKEGRRRGREGEKKEHRERGRNGEGGRTGWKPELIHRNTHVLATHHTAPASRRVGKTTLYTRGLVDSTSSVLIPVASALRARLVPSSSTQVPHARPPVSPHTAPGGSRIFQWPFPVRRPEGGRERLSCELLPPRCPRTSSTIPPGNPAPLRRFPEDLARGLRPGSL